jgi:hypothetical protein
MKAYSTAGLGLRPVVEFVAPTRLPGIETATRNVVFASSQLFFYFLQYVLWLTAANRKSTNSWAYSASAYVISEPVRKSQICKFL